MEKQDESTNYKFRTPAQAGKPLCITSFQSDSSESIQHTKLLRNSYLDRSVIIVVESAHNYSRRSEHRTIHTVVNNARAWSLDAPWMHVPGPGDPCAVPVAEALRPEPFP